MHRVGSSKNGSIQKRLESGISSMSDSLIEAHPRRLDASKPIPESNDSSLNWLMGTVTWCPPPGKSVNLISTNLTCSSTANCKTLVGSIEPNPPERGIQRIDYREAEFIRE